MGLSRLSPVLALLCLVQSADAQTLQQQNNAYNAAAAAQAAAAAAAAAASGGVTSVNGATGAVTITPASIGATTPAQASAAAPVQNVLNATGAITLGNLYAGGVATRDGSALTNPIITTGHIDSTPIGQNTPAIGIFNPMVAASPVILWNVPVSVLPTCNINWQNSISGVNDYVPAATLTGGGTLRRFVYCDGQAWTVLASPQPNAPTVASSTGAPSASTFDGVSGHTSGTPVTGSEYINTSGAAGARIYWFFGSWLASATP